MSRQAVQTLTVGYVRDDRRRSLRSQETMMREAGVDRVYTDWALLIRQRRKGRGDRVAVSDLWVIADPRQRTVKGGLRKSLMARRAELRRAGVAAIIELTTGLDSSIPEQDDEMLSAALDTLANSRARSRNIGRPRVEWTDAERVVIRMHWLSREHPNDRAALAAIRDDGIRAAGYVRVRAAFGPSGRMPGGQRPAKRAGKR